MLCALIVMLVVLAGLHVRDQQVLASAARASSSQPVARVQGKDALWWSRRAVQARKDANKRGLTIRRLRRQLAQRSDVQTAIALAAHVYHVDHSMLWRKARCETGGTFSAGAFNRSSSASGLFQFLPSTWRSTPFGVFSVWDPYANALAAGWMHANGRGGEWVCR